MDQGPKMIEARSSGFRSLSKCHRPLQLVTTIALSAWAALSPAGAFSEHLESWEQLQRDGTHALDRNEYWIAEPLLKKAVIQAGSFGFGDVRLAKCFGELGRLYAVRGRFTEAEPYLEQELAVKENALGKENGQIIPAMGSLIRFYILHGTASKAEPLTEELLAFVEGKLREPLEQTQAKVTMKKGQPLQGWAGSAAPVMRDPLIEWAITCDDLGGVYRSRGNFDVADRFFKAALDLKSTILGKEHLSLANSYDSLGDICLSRNESKDAESYYRDALRCTENVLPPENPVVYARLDKLAKCLIKAGKYDQAEQLYLRARNFWKEEPSKCGNEARDLYALGCLYDDQKNYSAAAPLFQQALGMSEQFNGPYSIQLVPYLQKYAYTLYYLGRRSESDQLKARASTIAGVIQ
jgi:tetratricopeptide (TPR) repeat protein